jgi:hypothetical protein
MFRCFPLRNGQCVSFLFQEGHPASGNIRKQCQERIIAGFGVRPEGISEQLAELAEGALQGPGAEDAQAAAPKKYS